MMRAPLLAIRDVTKDFGGLRALNCVNMDIEACEIRGLIGPNGSGKTTLINVLTGIYKPTRGRIFLNGRDVTGLAPEEIAQHGVIRTFQIPRVFRDMTVLENMLVPALAQGEPRHSAEKRAKELLEFVLLTRLQREPAKRLSGGQLMLLQIARGLMKQPLILYALDEPFAGVHVTIKEVIINTIRTMNSQGLTFLVISHEMSTIRKLCNNVSVLHQGALIAEGRVEELARNEKVVDAYLGAANDCSGA